MKRRNARTLKEKQFVTHINLFGQKEAVKAVKKIWYITDDRTAELLAKQLLEKLF